MRPSLELVSKIFRIQIHVCVVNAHTIVYDDMCFIDKDTLKIGYFIQKQPPHHPHIHNILYNANDVESVEIIYY